MTLDDELTGRTFEYDGTIWLALRGEVGASTPTIVSMDSRHHLTGWSWEDVQNAMNGDDK